MNDEVDRAAVFGQSGSMVERIDPGFAPEQEVAEHLARYRWAADGLSGLRVLDVACGVGYGAPVLRDLGVGSVTSVDLSAPALAFGGVRYQLRAVQADATHLPFPSRSFQAVVSLETIEHLPDPGALLAELARVLQPGGVLKVSCPDREMAKAENPYHLNEMTLPELQTRLERAGFTVESVEGQHWEVLGGALWKVRGVARMARALVRSPRVGSMRLPASRATVLCVAARTADR